MEEVVFELKKVSKRFSENVILDDVDCKVKKGTIFGIIGKSGCGKSTLLNVLVGFLKPNKGTILYKSNDIQKQLTQVEQECGFSSQDSSFYKKLNVLENLNYFGRLYGLNKKTIEERSKKLIRLFKLEGAERTLGDQLSRGMQKRLDMMCALIHDPEVLILDEPTADLDPILRREILHFVKEIHNQGKTVILTSHILGEIDYLCDEIVVLHQKRLMKIDPKANVKKVVIVETASREYKKLNSLLGKKAEGSKVNAGRLMIQTKDPQKVLEVVLKYSSRHKDPLVTAHISKVGLNDLFKSLVGEKK